MKRSFLCIGFALASLVAATPHSADAAKPILPCHEVVVEDLIASCKMRIHHSTPITLRLKSPVIETNRPKRWPVVDDVKPTGDMIVFETTEQARPEQIAGVYVVHTRKYSLYIVVSAAPSADDADAAIVLRHASELAMFNSAVTAKAREVAAAMIKEVRRAHAEELREKDDKHADEIAELQRMIAALQAYILEVANHAVIGAVIQGNRVTPIHQELDHNEGFSILGTDWVEVGPDRILRFDIYNHEDEPFPVTQVQVFNEDGTKEHTGTARIGAESTAMPPPEDGPLGVVGPKQRVSGAVLIRDHQSLGEAVKLSVRGPAGILPQIRIIPIDPVEPTPEEKKDRQVILGLRFQGGGCWLPGGISDGKGGEATDLTACGGFGLQVTKGISQLLAVEVAVHGSNTGEASFDQVTIDEMAGDLFLEGQQVRVTLGGLLRFGREGWIPVLRLGFSVQGTSYDSRFVVDGVEQPTPDLETEFTGGLMAGIGVSVRFFENFIAEAGISSVFRGTEELRALEAGIYTGYGW